MLKINDKKLYFWFAVAAIIITAVLALVSFYSLKVTEPAILAAIEKGEKASSPEETDKYFKEAYLQMRNGYIFAKYEYYDAEAASIKNIIKKFDEIVSKNEKFPSEYGVYLKNILERRHLGGVLGRNTMFFFLIISVLSFGMFLLERRKNS
jgi:hypothetical protein